MTSRTKHMHTVPSGYLAAFADRSVLRDKPHVWRFERQSEEPKLIGKRKTSAQQDIYTLWTEEGKPDLSIETELLDKGTETGFPDLVELLESGTEPSYWKWRQLSRFMAFQLLRTPRSFQLLRDAIGRDELGRNGAQLLMVDLAPKIENWICQLNWFLFSNPTEFPFLTSDNPVTTWADRGDWFETVGFHDPSLQVLFPLSPKMCVAAVQTPKSLKGIMSDSADHEGCFIRKYELSIQALTLDLDGVISHNRLTVAHAEKYVYANCKEDPIRKFLKAWFLQHPAPVRRDDLLPIGSPRVSGND